MIALSRKSCLFMGAAGGGRAAAIAYTLIETARLNDVDPQAWLAHTHSRRAPRNPPDDMTTQETTSMNDDALKRLEQVESTLAITRLKHLYWHYNDTGLRGDEIAALFTEDGVWSNAELGHYEGRNAIRDFFNGASGAIPFCAHVGMNEIIDIDGDTARAKWRCLLPATLAEQGEGKSHLILIDYRDDFVREGGRWFIRKLDILFNFNIEIPQSWVGSERVRPAD